MFITPVSATCIETDEIAGLAVGDRDYGVSIRYRRSVDSRRRQVHCRRYLLNRRNRFVHVFVLTYGAIGAEVVSVDVEPPGRHAIGDLMTLRIRVSGGKDSPPQMALPEESDVTWGKGEARKTKNGWEITLPFQVFRLGELDLPDMQLGVGTEVLNADIPPLEIVSVRSGEDAENLKDVRPPVGFPPAVWRWLLGIAGLILAMWLVRRWMQRQARPEPSMSELSPEEWLREQLERLRGLSVRNDEELRAFVADVADVVRNYLARIAGIPAPLRTTGETVAVAKSVLSTPALRMMERLLSEADFVKFAKHVPPKDAAADYLERSERFCASLRA